jgi:hypothetical protein|nr:hypothetical protein [Kofleriaceae bacterium]
MLRAGAVLLGTLAVAACHFHGGNAPDDSAPPRDAGGDAAVDAFVPLIDAPALCSTWHATGFDPCSLGSPGAALELTAAGSPYTYDTTDAGGVLTDKMNQQVATSQLTLAQSGGPTLAVLSVDGFQLDTGATLNVIGTKPLLIASWDALLVSGTLDAGSHTTETDPTKHVQQTTQLGAGAGSASECTTGDGVPGLAAVHTGGAGGGGGGALVGGGGSGGSGDTSCADAQGNGKTPCPRTGGAGGLGLGVPEVIRGGCAGAATGAAGDGVSAPATATTVALGGGGGGGVQLSARTTLTIGGELIAGGAGGAGAPQGSAVGGGGGGAGGYLALDAPMVTVTGIVAANGGGGGGSAPFGGFGAVGTDGAASNTAAPGGARNSGTCGEPGGNGAANTSLDGANGGSFDSCGGGGGGGGAGLVIVYSNMFVSTGSTISPPVTTPF